jgi:hypothetical protein
MNKLPQQQVHFKVSNAQSQDKFEVQRPSLMEMIQKHPANKVERFLEQTSNKPEVLTLSQARLCRTSGITCSASMAQQWPSYIKRIAQSRQ